jgi:ribosomal protein L11 methyltransferase
MNETLELKVRVQPREPWSEIAIAELAEAGFEGFVETEDGFLAYAPQGTDLEAALQHSVLRNTDEIEVEITTEVIPYQNWNAVWEAGFDPVYVEDYASILAPFHTGVETRGMTITIQPQMSFGTGHHQTTWLMTKALFEMGPLSEKVLDMGTGTGVLAIVAEKLGAKDVLAVDIEDWSVENAKENVTGNACQYIRCKCGDIDVIEESGFGLILANINKNVLKAHLPRYSQLLDAGGTLMLSGFFISDTDELIEAACAQHFEAREILQKDEWAAIKLIKK